MKKERIKSEKIITKSTAFVDQFETLKAKHPDSLLLFRVGDFYECYGVDAETAAKVIGLTITTRNPDKPDALKMAGFPYHQLELYLRKLVQAGHRVSVCERID